MINRKKGNLTQKKWRGRKRPVLHNTGLLKGSFWQNDKLLFCCQQMKNVSVYVFPIVFNCFRLPVVFVSHPPKQWLSNEILIMYDQDNAHWDYGYCAIFLTLLRHKIFSNITPSLDRYFTTLSKTEIPSMSIAWISDIGRHLFRLKFLSQECWSMQQRAIFPYLNCLPVFSFIY